MKHLLPTLVAGLFVIVVLAGCDQPRPASTSTYNKVSDDGKTYDSGPIGKDGKYEVANAPLGSVRLCVLVPELPPAPAGLKPKAGAADLPADASAVEILAATKAAQGVPKTYMDPKSSGLSATIQPGENTLDLPLSRKGSAANPAFFLDGLHGLFIGDVPDDDFSVVAGSNQRFAVGRSSDRPNDRRLALKGGQ